MAEAPHQSTAAGRNLSVEVAETAHTSHHPTAAALQAVEEAKRAVKEAKRAVEEAKRAVEVAPGNEAEAIGNLQAAVAEYKASKDQNASPEILEELATTISCFKSIFVNMSTKHRNALEEHRIALELLRIALEELDRVRKIAYPSTPTNRFRPMDADSFDQMLQKSPSMNHQRGAIQDAFNSLNPLLLNPWSQSAQIHIAAEMGDSRKNEMRKKSAKHYDRYRKKGNLAQCSVTGIWGDCNTVVGAHILPVRTTTTNLQKWLNMKGKLNDMRNVIPMLKTIERAYDNLRLCVVLHDPEGNDSKVTIRIFDPTLKKEIVHDTMTFGDLEGRPFELPEGGENKEGPFKRCLSFHAQTGYSEAKKRGWSSIGQPPIKYGSPLDSNKIAFVKECGSTIDETSGGSAI